MREPSVNAALTGLAVFVALYLAVGFGWVIRGWSWSMPLTWAYVFMSPFWPVVVFTLAGFIGVSYYVYRRKLRLLAQSSAKLGAYSRKNGKRSQRSR